MAFLSQIRHGFVDLLTGKCGRKLVNLLNKIFSSYKPENLYLNTHLSVPCGASLLERSIVRCRFTVECDARLTIIIIYPTKDFIYNEKSVYD